MLSFKKSLAGVVGMSLFVCALAALLSTTVRAETEKEKALRYFYLTQTKHIGSEAKTACAARYHMASLWEIFDTSNLRYDTELGLTQADSGSGPPSGELAFGWIRTGTGSSGAGTEMPGQANCLAWTAGTGAVRGTVVSLTDQWLSLFVTRATPWGSAIDSCSQAHSVWCVQD